MSTKTALPVLGAFAMCTLLSRSALAEWPPTLIVKDPIPDLHPITGVAGSPDPNLFSKDPSDFVDLATGYDKRCFVRRDGTYFCQHKFEYSSNPEQREWHTTYPFGSGRRV